MTPAEVLQLPRYSLLVNIVSNKLVKLNKLTKGLKYELDSEEDFEYCPDKELNQEEFTKLCEELRLATQDDFFKRITKALIEKKEKYLRRLAETKKWFDILHASLEKKPKKVILILEKGGGAVKGFLSVAGLDLMEYDEEGAYFRDFMTKTSLTVSKKGKVDINPGIYSGPGRFTDTRDWVKEFNTEPKRWYQGWIVSEAEKLQVEIP